MPAFAVNQTAEQRGISESFGKHGAVATEGRIATQAAIEILKRGGNAIDAFVAASFAVSVERPQATGLGGGGFLVYGDGKSGKFYAVDFRERAPKRATTGMFLDSNGEVVTNRSLDGILAAGVPGLVAGLYEVHQKFGSLPWSELLVPAIRAAEKGFRVFPALANGINKRKEILASFPSSKAVYLKKDGSPYLLGDILKQPGLAKTLRTIAKKGRDGFYSGHVAEEIVATSDRYHGLISEDDLASYQVHWREPLRTSFRGYELISMPPPSSGGINVYEILKMLEHDNLHALGVLSAKAIHLEASAMQLAFADRAKYLGDPDFVKVPSAELVSDAYAKAQRKRILPDAETPSSQIGPGDISVADESTNTTHMAIMDAQGNMISSTQTINGYMGSALVAGDTGVLLNNEMDDFSAKPGASNLFGAIGSDNNSIQPGKTPLSSMSPTLVMKNGEPLLAIGARGGTRIITCAAQAILDYLAYGLPLYDSVALARFHHQWKPDKLDFDAPGPGAEVLTKLSSMGYSVHVEPDGVVCRVMAVSYEAGRFHGMSDPRDIGQSLGW